MLSTTGLVAILTAFAALVALTLVFNKPNFFAVGYTMAAPVSIAPVFKISNYDYYA